MCVCVFVRECVFLYLASTWGAQEEETNQSVDDTLDGVVPLLNDGLCVRLQQELVACDGPQLQDIHT